jgi:phage-related tail fiber protein
MQNVWSPLDLHNQRIANLGSPSVATDAVNKQYVDNVAQGLDWKASTRAASTGNVTLATPGATLDGVTLANGDRVLLKDQSTGAQNGIYTYTDATTPLARASDAASAGQVTAGMAVTVEEGTVNGDKVFILITDGTITLGTTALAFTQLGGGGGTTYTSGTGISISGSIISVDTSVVARKVAANVGDGSSTSITVNHNLGTRDVQVQVYTNAAPYDTVLVETQRTDANNVLLVFGTAPATNAYRAVVEG